MHRITDAGAVRIAPGTRGAWVGLKPTVRCRKNYCTVYISTGESAVDTSCVFLCSDTSVSASFGHCSRPSLVFETEENGEKRETM